MCYIFRESMSETTFMTNSGHSGIQGNRGHGLLQEKGYSEIKTPGKTNHWSMLTSAQVFVIR